MRARRADGNQKALVEQMRSIPGLSVVHTHTVGKGLPDLILGYKGRNYLVEVKDPSQPPSKRKLTPDEVEFHESWTGSIHIVEKIEDVIKIIQ